MVLSMLTMRYSSAIVFALCLWKRLEGFRHNHHGQQTLGRSVRMSGGVTEVDVAVIGAGVGGCTVSWILADRHDCKVALIDPKVESGMWYPNYGAWRKEWNCLSDKLRLPEIKDCLTTEWDYTDCFFGGSNDIPMSKRTTLQQPYVRVDKKKLKDLYIEKFKASGNGVTVASKVTTESVGPNLFKQNRIQHFEDHSMITLDDGEKVKCKLIIDSTGAESSLVMREDPQYARGSDKELKTGYQIAYGFIAHVDDTGPYDPKAMTLFDYRTDHLEPGSNALADAIDRPTFMYVMPLQQYPDGSHQVFFEETSLVGEGQRRLSFETCKERAMKRLEFLGINVLGLEEEEYCYIPMGGELPDRFQRIVGFGAAANMVHPSTGYQACRMMASANDVAGNVAKGLNIGLSLDALAATTNAQIWNRRSRGQRDFQLYGGHFLEQQPVGILRGFFSAFFALDEEVWGGFLAGYPSLPGSHHHEGWKERLFGFALPIFLQMPNDVRLAMMLYAVQHVAREGPNVLLRSITPPFLFGEGAEDMPSPEVYSRNSRIASVSRSGDEAAKSEAVAMMKAFSPSGKYQMTVADTQDFKREASLSALAPEADAPAPFE